MMRFVGADLDEMRYLVAVTKDHITLNEQAKNFMVQMHAKSRGPVMLISKRQYHWLLQLVDTAVTFNQHYAGK